MNSLQLLNMVKKELEPSTLELPYTKYCDDNDDDARTHCSNLGRTVKQKKNSLCIDLGCVKMTLCYHFINLMAEILPIRRETQTNQSIINWDQTKLWLVLS